MPSARRMLGLFGALWGWFGVSFLLGKAVVRLTPFALELFSFPLSRRHWAALACTVAGMGYLKGYRLFQGGFSPRIAARVRHLRDHPRLPHVLLAPFFCMGFFHAPRWRIITSFSVTAAIILLVVLVRRMPQPWHGIVNCGVIVGLSWGLASLAVFTFDALVRDVTHCPAEVPD